VKIYFPNLNGLRFLAAFSVVISHVEMVKMVFGEDHIWHTRPIKMLGHLGVILFLALSGLLITYLLYAEKKHTKKISVRNFYVRRIVRIWPLYFTLIILGLFILPDIPFLDVPTPASNLVAQDAWWSMALLYLLILPNIAVKAYPAVAFIGHTWSIGVEEQFYLIWPWLVKLNKHVLNLLIAVIVIYLIVLWGSQYYVHMHPESRPMKIFHEVWLTTCIDCMAIGGIFAWIYFHKKHNILNFLYHPIINIGTVVLTISMVAVGIRFPILHHEIYAFLFSIIILNFATNPQPYFNLENKVFNYLGKISYGIYMYHVLCIVIAYKLVIMILGQHNNILLYILSYILTVIFAAISYELMESKFIKLKHGFSSILSGDLAKKSKKL